MEIIAFAVWGLTAILTLVGMAVGLNRTATNAFAILWFGGALLAPTVFVWWSIIIAWLVPLLSLILSGKTYNGNTGEITNR